MELACVCEKTGFIFLAAVEGAISKICTPRDQKGEGSGVHTTNSSQPRENYSFVHSPRLLNYSSGTGFPPADLRRSCSFTQKISERRDHRFFYCCAGISLDCCCSSILRPEGCCCKIGHGRLAHFNCIGKKSSASSIWFRVLLLLLLHLIPFLSLSSRSQRSGNMQGMLTRATGLSHGLKFLSTVLYVSF